MACWFIVPSEWTTIQIAETVNVYFLNAKKSAIKKTGTAKFPPGNFAVSFFLRTFAPANDEGA